MVNTFVEAIDNDVVNLLATNKVTFEVEPQ